MFDVADFRVGDRCLLNGCLMEIVKLVPGRTIQTESGEIIEAPTVILSPRADRS